MQLLGYTYSERRQRWEPCYNTAEALAVPDDDALVLGSTVEECAAVLEQRFPTDDPRLTRVLRTEQYVDGSKATVLETTDENTCSYCGKDFAEAKALAKAHPHVCISLHNDVRRWLDDKQRQQLADEGFSEGIRNDSWYNSRRLATLTYITPAATRQRLHASATRKANDGVTCADVTCAADAALSAVRCVIGQFYMDTRGPYSRKYVSEIFMDGINAMTIVFGNYSWRKLQEFRVFKLKWKARAEASRKRFHGHADACTQMCNFMDREIRVKNGKIAPRSWFHTSARALDRDQFDDDVYDYKPPAPKEKSKSHAKRKGAKGRKRAR
jgi:hypothetical protein